MQVEKPVLYHVSNKVMAYGLTFMGFLFLLGGFMLLEEKNVIMPTWINGLSIVYAYVAVSLAIFFVKDLLFYFKTWLLCLIVTMTLFHLAAAYFLIDTAIQEGGIIEVVIFILIGILYLTFIKDLFYINTLVEQRLPAFSDRLRLLKLLAKNGVIIEDASSFMDLGRVHSNENSLFWKAALILLLPFIFLGKGASYVLAISVASSLDVHAYMLASIGFLISLVLIVSLLPMLMVFLKLRYPNHS